MIELQCKDLTKLKLEIAKQGHSQRSFSKEIGVSQGYLSQVLRGSHIPSAKIAYKIANGLNSDISEFFLVKVIDISNIGLVKRESEVN